MSTYKTGLQVGFVRVGETDNTKGWVAGGLLLLFAIVIRPREGFIAAWKEAQR